MTSSSHILHSTLCTLRSALYTSHSTVRTLHSALSTSLHTLQSRLHTLHSKLYTLHSVCLAPQISVHAPYSSFHTLHFTLRPHSNFTLLSLILHYTPTHSTIYAGTATGVKCSRLFTCILFYQSVLCDCIRVPGMHLVPGSSCEGFFPTGDLQNSFS